MIEPLMQYFRLPRSYARFATEGILSHQSGFFHFCDDLVCFGKYSGRDPGRVPSGSLSDARLDLRLEDGTVYLPFDIGQVADSLRLELYRSTLSNGHFNPYSFLAPAYYLVRPMLSVQIRKYLQRLRLSDWREVSFPQWPVDRTVDILFQRLMLLALKAQRLDKIPFIWFWPNGASSAAIMTHDVETTLGRDFCETLMDIDDAYGIKASFQVVPEKRYEVPSQYLDSIWNRGFEVAVQDLNHDGHLYRDRELFLERAAKINEWRKKFNATGFRSAVLYRNQLWFDAFEFSYDMSVPNVAHLDPQRGGCCTVMPYFVGKILELPVTTIQDYSLFYILNDYSIDIWKRQIQMIMEQHGLVNLIIHPDYIIKKRERAIFEHLLHHLVETVSSRRLWMALPSEVDHWWRQRAQMEIVEDDTGLRIEGPGKERAQIAFAKENRGELIFEFASQEAAR